MKATPVSILLLLMVVQFSYGNDQNDNKRVLERNRIGQLGMLEQDDQTSDEENGFVLRPHEKLVGTREMTNQYYEEKPNQRILNRRSNSVKTRVNRRNQQKNQENVKKITVTVKDFPTGKTFEITCKNNDLVLTFTRFFKITSGLPTTGPSGRFFFFRGTPLSVAGDLKYYGITDGDVIEAKLQMDFDKKQIVSEMNLKGKAVIQESDPDEEVIDRFSELNKAMRELEKVKGVENKLEEDEEEEFESAVYTSDFEEEVEEREMEEGCVLEPEEEEEEGAKEITVILKDLVLGRDFQITLFDNELVFVLLRKLTDASGVPLHDKVVDGEEIFVHPKSHYNGRPQTSKKNSFWKQRWFKKINKPSKGRMIVLNVRDMVTRTAYFVTCHDTDMVITFAVLFTRTSGIRACGSDGRQFFFGDVPLNIFEDLKDYKISNRDVIIARLTNSSENSANSPISPSDEDDTSANTVYQSPATMTINSNNDKTIVESPDISSIPSEDQEIEEEGEEESEPVVENVEDPFDVANDGITVDVWDKVTGRHFHVPCNRYGSVAFLSVRLAKQLGHSSVTMSGRKFYYKKKKMSFYKSLDYYSIHNGATIIARDINDKTGVTGMLHRLLRTH